MVNSQGNTEAYHEVIHEDKIKIGIANNSRKSLHDEIVQLVDTMLQKQRATLPEQQQLEQCIVYTNDKINEKVYALYGLGKEVAAVVEGV